MCECVYLFERIYGCLLRNNFSDFELHLERFGFHQSWVFFLSLSLLFLCCIALKLKHWAERISQATYKYRVFVFKFMYTISVCSLLLAFQRDQFKKIHFIFIGKTSQLANYKRKKYMSCAAHTHTRVHFSFTIYGHIGSSYYVCIWLKKYIHELTHHFNNFTHKNYRF